MKPSARSRAATIASSLLDNPDRFVPYALNLAVEEAPSPVIVRVDSHAVIAPDYVDAAVATLFRTGADVVGGPMRPTAETPVGRAVAWALTSRWGVGGSRFHLEGAAGETDSVYMGVFPRATFERFGRFDERFSRNQDDEFTYRVREQGGRVVLDPAMRSTYTPRDDFGALYRQFRGYGRFKPLVLRTHPSGLRLRHLAPPLVALAWAALPLGVVRRRFLVDAPRARRRGGRRRGAGHAGLARPGPRPADDAPRLRVRVPPRPVRPARRLTDALGIRTGANAESTTPA